MATLNEYINELRSYPSCAHISPLRLALILETAQEELGIETLLVDFAVSAKAFSNKEVFDRVFEKMQNGVHTPFRICIIYVSGLRIFFYPTCVKASYVSLHSKAGSCELHFLSDGTFTISGTTLW